MLQRTVLAVLASTLAAMTPAQQKPGGSTGKPPTNKSAKDKDPVGKAPKDDKLTASDPVITAIDKWKKAKVSQTAADWRQQLSEPPRQTFDPARIYRWHLDTSQGPLVITLLPEAAPRHVTSVIFLSRCGFYDGLFFPRVIRGFMAQGGSPTNTESGNAGYSMDGEFLTNQKHDKPGALSSANSGPGTDGSQFFLTFVPTPHLDGKHTVHGFVTEGLPTLKAIDNLGVEKDGDALAEKVTILRTWITVSAAQVAPTTGNGKGGAKK